MTDGENDVSHAPPAAPPRPPVVDEGALARPPAPPSPAAHPAIATARQTVIEEGTSLSGTLEARGPILVMGRLEGTVAGPTVEVTATGALSGRLKAGTLRSRGALGGHLDADEVDLGGTVMDQTVIHARALAVTLGDGDAAGAAFGDCELNVGEEPDREQAVSAASTPPRTGLFDSRTPR